MALYKDICLDLLQDGTCKEVYRFQGARTHSILDFNGKQNDGYIYYSNSLDHHKYFTLKRLKQTLNDALKKETGESLSSMSIQNLEVYRALYDLIKHTNYFNQMHSFKIACSRDFDTLAKENYILHEAKDHPGRYIERVDRRVFGGGYGLADEWKKLFVYLTYFSADKRISRDDLIKLIQNMKISGKINKRENISFMFDNNYSYQINSNIFSDFNKYQIINLLESILEKDLVSSTSSLYKEPSKTIKEVVTNYEKGREKVLTALDRRHYY